jgi:hypothetical protein
MEALLDSPFTAPVVAAMAVSLLAALIAWGAKSSVALSFGALLAFLAAYYETYQKIPSFPPAGAANKVFYVALIGGLAVIALERWTAGRWARVAFAIGVSAFAAIWIGWAKFASPDALTYPLAGLAVLGGALALGGLDGMRQASGAAGLAGLAALFALAAPTALFGGSSTGVGLCLGALAGIALLSLAALLTGRALWPSAVTAAGGGLAAMLDTLALVSRAADPFALALIVVAPFLGLGAVRYSPAAWRAQPWRVWLVGGLATLSPLPVILALLFLRHENPLGS